MQKSGLATSNLSKASRCPQSNFCQDLTIEEIGSISGKVIFGPWDGPKIHLHAPLDDTRIETKKYSLPLQAWNEHVLWNVCILFIAMGAISSSQINSSLFCNNRYLSIIAFSHLKYLHRLVLDSNNISIISPFAFKVQIEWVPMTWLIYYLSYT